MNYVKNPIFWIIFLVLFLLLLWLLFGGQSHDFIGISDINLKPIEVEVSSPVKIEEILTPTEFTIESPLVPSFTPTLKTSEDEIKQKKPILKLIIPREPGAKAYIQEEPEELPEEIPENSEDLEDSDSRIDQTPILPIEISKFIPFKFKGKTKMDASVGEGICRQVLEEYYGKVFPKCEPEFLRNPETGRCLELDGFNEELKIAFEYNGVQHYAWPNWTGQSKREFQMQIRRDQYKLDRCDQLGIYLIVIPYNVPQKLIRDYIIYYLPESVAVRQKHKSKTTVKVKELL